MGVQPMAERDDGKVYPLRLVECGSCTLVQLDYIVDQRELFPPEHPYATGNTPALLNHFVDLAMSLVQRTRPGDLVVDIGANDGTFLNAVRNIARIDNGGVRTVAVEPTNQAFKARDAGHDVYQEFFSARVARKIVEKQGTARFVVASNVLAHVPYVHDFLEGVHFLLDPERGIFVTENHDLTSVMDGMQVDTVYHEHLRYYTITSLSRLLALHDLSVYQTEPVPVHGGSFRTFAVRRQGGFADRARATAERLHRLVEQCVVDSGRRVWGIGASTRATPLIHFARIAPFIDNVAEVPGSAKIGMRMPGTEIMVVDEKEMLADQPPYAVLFSWHWASSIMPKLREAGYAGSFIIPLPEPRVIDG